MTELKNTPIEDFDWDAYENGETASAKSRVMSAGVRESSSSSGAGSVNVSTDPSRVMVTCCKSMPKLPS